MSDTPAVTTTPAPEKPEKKAEEYLGLIKRIKSTFTVTPIFRVFVVGIKNTFRHLMAT
jgi:hypothetical protein